MKELAVIVPTRGRPENIVDLDVALLETTDPADLRLYLAVDADDTEIHAYRAVAEAIDATVLVGESSGGMTAALNRVAVRVAAFHPAVAFLGDDHRPRTPGWARRFLEALDPPAFVYGNDLLMGERIPTAVAMTSDVIRALGYMAPPTLAHLNVDVAWLEWGRRLGRITYLDDVVIEHVHPAAGKAPLDAGYERVNAAAMVERDGAAWQEYIDAGVLEADVGKLLELLA